MENNSICRICCIKGEIKGSDSLHSEKGKNLPQRGSCGHPIITSVRSRQIYYSRYGPPRIFLFPKRLVGWSADW